MRPIVLHGHDRPITQIRFNREGDLLFSAAKGSGNACHISLWLADSGQRIGTYEGHTGTIWTIDVTVDSKYLLSAAADSHIRLWDVQTGAELWVFHKPPQTFRACQFSLDNKYFAVTADKFLERVANVLIFKMEDDPTQVSWEPIAMFDVPDTRSISRILWINLNREILACCDDGTLKRLDAETGKLLQSVRIHDDKIQDMQISADGTHIITASSDAYAKIVDTSDLSVLKTFYTERPINSAAMHPTFLHVLCGGGQDSSQVTTTAAGSGGFEARFFHKVFTTEFANVRGHFSPINSVAISPDGRVFATGAEESNIRLCHFDDDYHEQNFEYAIPQQSSQQKAVVAS